MNNDLIIKRGAANKIAEEPVVDGALLLDKESGVLYADVDDKRLEVGATVKKDATFNKNVTIYGNADVKGSVVATSIVAKSDAELGDTSCTRLTANNATCENLTVNESMFINAPYVSANRIEGTSVNLPSENDFLVNETSFKSLLLDAVYPIGSLYWSRNETDPSMLFGGTWKRIKNKFILAAGDEGTTYAVGKTGGAATVTLKVSEMPGHNHTITVNNGGAHYHKVGIEEASKSTTGGTWSVVRPYDKTVNTASWVSNSESEHTHTASAANTGGGAAHENMPPYVAFYCWERIDPSTETGNEQ
jgi:hypothetical protein